MGEPATPATAEVDLRQAVEAAKEFLLALEKDRLVIGPIVNLVLEEVSQTDSGHWLITLGYRTPSPLDGATSAGAALLAGLRAPRSDILKVFTVDRNTGQVTAMSMREPRGD
jgi:hypothetical protein